MRLNFVIQTTHRKNLLLLQALCAYFIGDGCFTSCDGCFELHGFESESIVTEIDSAMIVCKCKIKD